MVQHGFTDFLKEKLTKNVQRICSSNLITLWEFNDTDNYYKSEVIVRLFSNIISRNGIFMWIWIFSLDCTDRNEWENYVKICNLLKKFVTSAIILKHGIYWMKKSKFVDKTHKNIQNNCTHFFVCQDPNPHCTNPVEIAEIKLCVSEAHYFPTLTKY